MDVVWDSAKAERNLREHGIDFADAARAFEAPLLVREDTRHDYGEARYRALGDTEGRIIEIVFTVRNDAIRLISA